MKQAAKTMNFLTEHEITSYEELESKLAALTEKWDTALASIKGAERRTTELALVEKHVTIYRQLKPVYDRYRQSRDKEKFLRGHESEIILFEATSRELKRMNAVPLPPTESMKTELTALAEQKETLYTEHTAARGEAREYETINQNVDALLSVPKEQERQHEREER